MGWLTEPLGYDFALRALAEVVVMGVSCGAIGAYVVVRRLAFIGDAISHAVFPGIVIAYLLGASIVLGALAAGVLTALAIGWVARGGRIREDTSIGIFFAAAFALGVVLISTPADLPGRPHWLPDRQSPGRLGRRPALQRTDGRAAARRSGRAA